MSGSTKSSERSLRARCEYPAGSINGSRTALLNSRLRSFLFYPVYWLAYNQMTGNLTSQAAVMELNHVPNDIINNINPISLIVRPIAGLLELDPS